MQKNVSDGLPLPQRYGAIATIVIGISMAVLDGAIANVALPTIAKDLNASPASSIWIVNAYQIAIVISLLSLSFLGDMFGYRRVYQCGLVVFTLTSLFCALSDSLHTLTLARIAQGFGGAALMSVNTALIRLIYPHRHLGRGMGINSFIVAVSSAAGPTIAAAILSVASWQWLFAINVPAGAARAVTAGRFAAYSAVFAINLYLHLLVLRPDAGAGCAAILFAERAWPFGSGNRLVAHTLAFGNHGDGPAGRVPY